MLDHELELLTELRLSILRALWGAVIPSLRRVRLEWNPGNSTALILFYHDGTITSSIEDHYSYIWADVSADFVNPIIDMKIMECKYPSVLPNESYVIYARKEPFVDPE